LAFNLSSIVTFSSVGCYTGAQSLCGTFFFYNIFTLKSPENYPVKYDMFVDILFHSVYFVTLLVPFHF